MTRRPSIPRAPDNRYLSLELDECSSTASWRPTDSQAASASVIITDTNLALTVVAQRRAVYSTPPAADILPCFVQIVGRAHRREAHRPQAVSGQKGLLSESMLRDGERLPTWSGQAPARRRGRRRRGHVLELERDDVDARRELTTRSRSLVRRLDFNVRDLSGWVSLLWCQGVDAI